MYSQARRKKRSESMEVQTAADEEDDNNSKDNADGSRPKTRRAERSNLASLASPVSESYQRSQAVHVANLLHEAGLTDVLHSDWSEQIKYFLSERSYLIHQIEIIRSQYGIIKKRLDESETENEKLLTENRILSKEVLLYRNLINAPPSADGNSKDYTQLRSKIDQVLLENARLYQEINAFKTSDPVYEQVQILEEQKKQLEKDFNRLKAQLKLNESSVITSISDTTNVSPKRNKIDEQQRQQITRLQTENHTLNSKLNSATDECEQLRLLNKKLISDIEQLRQVRSPTILSATKNTNYLSTIIDSSTTTTNRDHKAKSKSRAHRYTTEIVPLTQSNLKYFDSSSRKSLTSPISQRTTPDHEIVELREHVRRLENTLHQREIELGKLQQEIEKGTSSIMSSIEDLFLISTPPPSTQQSPSKGSTSHDKELVLPLPRSTVVNTLSSSLVVSTTDEIERLQTELDQLHDKLDDISRENQLLRDRVQDCETVEEENVFLYAKKQKLDDEIERGRMRELLIEQELKLLQDKLKGAEGNRDNKGGQSTIMDTSQTIGNISNMKLKIDRLHRVNNQLELEVIGLRDELQLTNNKYEQCKRELYQKDEHYKKLLAIIEDNQRFPQELPRLEKLNVELENQLENQKKEYDIKIHDLQERNEKREQKYSSLYESILKLQSDYRQKEIDYVNTMDDVIRQREELRLQINQLKQQYEQLQHEYQILKGELESKEEINRDLKLALTSSTNDTQSIYTQLRHLNTSLSDLQIKYNRDMKDRNDQIDQWKIENKNLMTTHEIELVQARQTIAQLQQNNIQIDNLRSTIDKLQLEIAEKQGYIEHIQNDLSERSVIHTNRNTQLSQENKNRAIKIIELEQSLSHEQQRRTDIQRSLQEVQLDLLKAKASAKEANEKNIELEKRLREADKRFEESLRSQLIECTEPSRRELSSIRVELIAKSEQLTVAQQALDEEKLRRQRIEMKLKRLKDEYIVLRKELHQRSEENDILQHELVERQFKNDYNMHVTNQTTTTLRSNESDQQPATTAVQLYLKEKADNQHWQLKCRTYQQKLEHLQKNYELAKQRYKQRLQEERDSFDRAKSKYMEHVRNAQRDLHDTRSLLEKEAECKLNQEQSYQQLIDERRQLLTSMVDKDAKVREMRRENLLLTSKIQLLEDQMENLNDRVDRTLRERNQLRREIASVRFDSNLSIETSSRSSPVTITSGPSRTTTTHIETSPSGWHNPVHYTESFGFNGFNETNPFSTTTTNVST